MSSTKFQDFLFTKKKYNINTAAKCINTLITILTAAEAEGHHSNRKCIGKQFRAKRIDVDSIYLTKEEADALRTLPESNKFAALAKRMMEHEDANRSKLAERGEGTFVSEDHYTCDPVAAAVIIDESIGQYVDKYVFCDCVGIMYYD